MNDTHSKPCCLKTDARGRIYSRAQIHPTAILGPDVTVEDGVIIDAYTVIEGTVHIQSGTRIHSHVSIGAPAQATLTRESFGSVSIGRNTIIREFASIHASKKSNGKTVVGDNCYVMTYTHIAHDVVIEDNVTLTNRVSIGGHAHIGKNAVLMASAAIHQSCRVGAYTALAPYSGARQDLPPFCTFQGQPGRFAGLNRVALDRAGLTGENKNALKHVTHLFFQKKEVLLSIIEQAQNEPSWGDDPSVQEFLRFIQESDRGVSRKTINNT